MEATRKVTIRVPEDLRRRAQGAAGAGITETILAGLELLVVRQACDGLRSLRGKVDLGSDLNELRDDRR